VETVNIKVGEEGTEEGEEAGEEGTEGGEEGEAKTTGEDEL